MCFLTGFAFSCTGDFHGAQSWGFLWDKWDEEGGRALASVPTFCIHLKVCLSFAVCFLLVSVWYSPSLLPGCFLNYILNNCICKPYKWGFFPFTFPLLDNTTLLFLFFWENFKKKHPTVWGNSQFLKPLKRNKARKPIATCSSLPAHNLSGPNLLLSEPLGSELGKARPSRAGGVGAGALQRQKLPRQQQGGIVAVTRSCITLFCCVYFSMVLGGSVRARWGRCQAESRRD